MSLSPLDSFQSRFVTYLMNFLRTFTLADTPKEIFGNQTKNYIVAFCGVQMA